MGSGGVPTVRKRNDHSLYSFYGQPDRQGASSGYRADITAESIFCLGSPCETGAIRHPHLGTIYVVGDERESQQTLLRQDHNFYDQYSMQEFTRKLQSRLHKFPSSCPYVIPIPSHRVAHLQGMCSNLITVSLFMGQLQSDFSTYWSSRNGPYQEKEILEFIRGVSQAVLFCHDRGLKTVPLSGQSLLWSAGSVRLIDELLWTNSKLPIASHLKTKGQPSEESQFEFFYPSPQLLDSLATASAVAEQTTKLAVNDEWKDVSPGHSQRTRQSMYNFASSLVSAANSVFDPYCPHTSTSLPSQVFSLGMLALSLCCMEPMDCLYTDESLSNNNGTVKSKMLSFDSEGLVIRLSRINYSSFLKQLLAAMIESEQTDRIHMNTVKERVERELGVDEDSSSRMRKSTSVRLLRQIIGNGSNSKRNGSSLHKKGDTNKNSRYSVKGCQMSTTQRESLAKTHLLNKESREWHLKNNKLRAHQSGYEQFNAYPINSENDHPAMKSYHSTDIQSMKLSQKKYANLNQPKQTSAKTFMTPSTPQSNLLNGHRAQLNDQMVRAFPSTTKHSYGQYHGIGATNQKQTSSNRNSPEGMQIQINSANVSNQQLINQSSKPALIPKESNLNKSNNSQKNIQQLPSFADLYPQLFTNQTNDAANANCSASNGACSAYTIPSNQFNGYTSSTVPHSNNPGNTKQGEKYEQIIARRLGNKDQVHCIKSQSYSNQRTLQMDKMNQLISKVSEIAKDDKAINRQPQVSHNDGPLSLYTRVAQSGGSCMSPEHINAVQQSRLRSINMKTASPQTMQPQSSKNSRVYQCNSGSNIKSLYVPTHNASSPCVTNHLTNLVSQSSTPPVSGYGTQHNPHPPLSVTGTISPNNISMAISQSMIRYQGQFVNSQWHGFGTVYFIGGSRFSGNFINGVADGYGCFYLETGGIISGEWKNNRIKQY